MNRKLEKKLGIFRAKLIGDCKIVRFQGKEKKS
jgi:hypothetical protein